MTDKTMFSLPQLVRIPLGQYSNCFYCSKNTAPIIKGNELVRMNCLQPKDFTPVAVHGSMNLVLL